MRPGEGDADDGDCQDHRGDEVAEEIGAHLVVVGHRPQGTLARWFGSVGSYLVKRLRCSVLVAQTEISDDEFDRLKPPEKAA